MVRWGSRVPDPHSSATESAGGVPLLAGGTLSGRTNVEECLTLQLAATDVDARLVQVCVVDHSAYAPPHLHLQLLFSDRSRSPWVGVNNATLLDLQSVLEALREQTGRLRLHIHEPALPANPASKAVVQALPRHVLLPAEAALLHADGAATCPICLSEYGGGDEIVCMPCLGLHKAHWGCMHRWLDGASTCPTCRYALPNKAEDGEPASAELMRRAEAEIMRVRNCEPAPCRLTATPDGAELLAQEDERRGEALLEPSEQDDPQAVLELAPTDADMPPPHPPAEARPLPLAEEGALSSAASAVVWRDRSAVDEQQSDASLTSRRRLRALLWAEKASRMMRRLGRKQS
mmetsp:Transcript_16541/g.34939  ORF Transcript_16541/g.34939 Transcript_16541/m.34939 type:complete len:347 (-) Transcript_16541:202-1242(-)